MLECLNKFEDQREECELRSSNPEIFIFSCAFLCGKPLCILLSLS